MDAFFKYVGLIFFSMIFDFVMSLIPAFIWYCFDDQLAKLIGNPDLGAVPFWCVYAFCWFVVRLRGVDYTKPKIKM